MENKTGKPLLLVAFGDSTTAPREGVCTYSEILQVKLPASGTAISVENAGVRGNTTAMARERFEQDVLSRCPGMVIIQFGINDAMVDVHLDPPATAPRVALGDYAANLEFFIAGAQIVGAEVIMMTPNRLRWTPDLLRLYGRAPYLPDDPDGLNGLLDTYAQAARECASRLGVPLIDVNACYKARSLAAPLAEDKLLLDGMHPNSLGQRLVADLLMEQIRPSRK